VRVTSRTAIGIGHTDRWILLLHRNCYPNRLVLSNIASANTFSDLKSEYARPVVDEGSGTYARRWPSSRRSLRFAECP
jgi:hypothetical protein